METALAAIVIIFVVLFAVLTMANTVIDTQDTLQAAWQEMDERLLEQARTAFSVVETRTQAGTRAELTVQNSGHTRLADFQQWDVIVQYYDDAAASALHIEWLPYTAAISASNEWTVEGIYADAATKTAEVYEPGILNTGEEAIIVLQLAPPIEAGSYVQVMISASNSSGTSTIFRRNVPPALANNLGIRVNQGESVVITQAELQTTDVDDIPADLAYTVTTPVSYGVLDPDAEFTQEQIDAGLLTYTPAGTDADSFTFSVTDGEDTIGDYVFTITVNTPPVIDANTGMNLPAGTVGLIGDLMLHANDTEAPPAGLVFTVTTPPAQGSLSLTTFTQDDINNARLSYNHTGSGSDSFEFTLSDGEMTAGPFIFNITVMQA